MANIARTYSVSSIFQGPCDLYINVPAPTSSLTPTADANTLTLDTSGQPAGSTGSHSGSTEGPVSIVITEKCNEIVDDQHESPIDVAMDSVEAEIDFTMKETNLSRLQTILSSASLGAYTSLANSQALQVGGQFDSSVSTMTLLLVAPNRSASGKFLYAMLYKAFLASALNTGFQRNKESIWKIKVRAVMDLTRVQGDELAQIVRTK